MRRRGESRLVQPLKPESPDPLMGIGSPCLPASALRMCDAAGAGRHIKKVSMKHHVNTVVLVHPCGFYTSPAGENEIRISLRPDLNCG